MSDVFHYFNTFGFNRDKVNSRLRLFELREQDKLTANLLHDLVIKPHLKKIIDEFYDYQYSHKEYREFFSEMNSLDKLKKNQTNYLNSLGKHFDHFSYFDTRLRIGIAHQRIDMPLSLFECAYGKLREILITLIPQAVSAELQKELSTFLLKIFSFDMSIIIDSYHHQEVSSLLKSINDLEKKHSKLKELSHLDPLTGIANRSYLMQHLTRDIEKLTAKDKLCLIMIDIDRLGEINDSLGHLAGDFVIKEIIQRLNSVTQHTMLGRYGGDEFLMIAYNADLTDAKQIMLNNIRLVEKSPITLGNQPININISQGAVQIKSKEPLASIIQRVGKELTRYKLKKYPP